MRLAGRVALVTGAGEGIGRGIARRFVREGAVVVVAERNVALGEQTVAALRAELGGVASFVACDVAVRTEVEGAVAHTVAEHGAIDILVNNAWGGGEISRVEDKTDEQIAAAFAVGYSGPRWAMNAAFPHMRRAAYGRVINLCSLNGVNAHMGSLEYNSAKEALRTLSRTAAREWADTGVVVNVICPAARSAALERVAASNPELIAMADALNPMGRMGDPEEDIAPVAVFLASDDARYLTGNTLFVDGGGHINGAPWAPALPERPAPA